MNTAGRGYSIVVFILIFLVPIYPTISSYFYKNNQYDFLRSDIDESSILESYYASDAQDSGQGPLLESSDSFLSVRTTTNDQRDLVGTNEIVNYEVKFWDNVSSIAYKFWISGNSIYWANDFSKEHIIRPGDTIKIPPVSGLIYKIQKGDTIDAIAQKYKLDKNDILKQNLLSLNDHIRAGDILVLPWAIKQAPKPVNTQKNIIKNNALSQSKWGSQYKFSDNGEYVDESGSYKLVWRQPQHNFYWWNCTWYVAQYKNVNWWWDANDWLRNARAKGHATWSSPKLGSIVVFEGRGYNPVYGHVWIVVWLKWGDIIVSDMNYRKLNEVTYRRVAKSDRAIQGYIYAE